MKQHYCFDCGIPVIDRLNRETFIAYLCPQCALMSKASIDNGVDFRSPQIDEKPRAPRWNYPREKIYRAKNPIMVPEYNCWTPPNVNIPTIPNIQPQWYYTTNVTTATPLYNPITLSNAN